MIVLWMLGVVVGLSFAIWASQHALDGAVLLGRALGLSPFIVGVTIVAVGTDLPEVANSIVASARGRGDLNVGNSIGSVVTQLTLVFGILSLVGRLEASRRLIVTVGSLTTLSLLTGAVIFSDGHFGRADGALLVAFWIGGTFLIQRPAPDEDRQDQVAGPVAPLVAQTLGFLLLVGVGAALAVESFTRAAETLGAPEYVLSFFVLAAGTSLPELVIDARALRQNQGALAMGDVLGSSFVDATLSPGIGPLLFPTVLSAGVERGNVVAAAVVVAVAILLYRSPSPGGRTAIALVCLYLALYPALLA